MQSLSVSFFSEIDKAAGPTYLFINIPMVDMVIRALDPVPLDRRT